MNDWRDYLEHSQLGKEREGHKYYARVADGTDRLGRIRYRYFYDAREYGAYMTNQKQSGSTGNGIRKNGEKRSTYYITGRGSAMIPGSAAQEYLHEARTNHRYGYGRLTTVNKDGKATSGQFYTGRAQTVRDHKTLRKVKHNVKAVAKRGKAKVASLLQHAAKKLNS